MRTFRGDLVTLSLSEAEIEQAIADLENLYDALVVLPTLTEQDREDMDKTFDTAITALQMVWLNMQEDDTEVLE